MTPELLAGLGGIALSLAFSYITGLSERYAALDPTQKRGVMLAAIVAVAVAALGASCVSVYNAVTCDRDGAVLLAQCVLSALVANQSAYALTPTKANA